MKLGVAEILEKASKIASRKEKIDYLRENQSFPMKIVLQYALDPNIEWLLPPGAPPYKANQLEDQESVLYHEAKKMYLFVKGGNDNLKPLRREALFLQLLENVTPEDAKLLLAAKDKKIPYPGITYKLIKEAFPDILP
jgi:hypothetical protein